LKTSRQNQAKEEHPRTIHVIHKDGQYKVFDAQGKFRAGFVSQEKADDYAKRLMTPRPFETTQVLEAML
jgi:hypothetical protein